MIEDLKETNLVVQDNVLINSSYDMTVLQQKLLLILISTIKKTDDRLYKTTFKVQSLAKILNTKPEILYRDLPKACKSLVEKVVEIKHPNGDWEMFNIISYAKYIKHEGKIVLEINDKAKNYLLKLKNLFTSFELYNIINLSSKHSIRIYQILKSFSYRGSVTISIEELKTTLKLPKSYSRFNNLSSKILEPSINDINCNTDIFVHYTLIKENRSVVGINFYISQQSRKIRLPNNNSFFNFEERNYDYEFLEKKLLGWD